jgi:hypothetical protein
VDLDHEVTPRRPIAFRNTKFVSEPDASDERGMAIHDHQLAMVTEKIVQALAEVDDVVNAKVNAGSSQPQPVSLVQPQ